MAWIALPVFADGEIFTAAQANGILEQLRANSPELADAMGQLFYATGANSLEALDLGAEGTLLLSGSTLPAWIAPLNGSLTQREVLDDSSDDSRVALWGVYRQSFHEAL